MTGEPLSFRSLGPIRLSLQEPDQAKTNQALRDCSSADSPSAILLVPVGGSIRAALHLGEFEISAGAAVLLPWQQGLQLTTIDGKCYVVQNLPFRWPDQLAENTASYILESSAEQASILLAFIALLLGDNASEDEDQQVALGIGLKELIRYAFSTPMSLALDHTGNHVTTKTEPIANIQAWIHTQLQYQNLNAAGIAKHFFISRSTLYQMFKPLGGVHAYIQSSRLILARNELESPANNLMTISALASKSGFASISSFTRAFKKYWHVAPSLVRKSALERNAQPSETGVSRCETQLIR